MDLSTRTLPNGMTVASVRLPGFRTVAIGAFLRTGSRHEPGHLNGLSHFFEHMAFKGTERRDARRISFEAELVGANMNAFTTKDHTAYHLTLLAEHAPLALELLADVLRRSTFPADEIEREREVILQEIGESADDPLDIAQDAFDATAFPGQALGKPILGSPDVVRTVQRDDFVEYLQSRYVGRNLVVVGVGGIDHDAFLAQAAECFGDLPPGEPSAGEPARYEGGLRHEDEDFEQTSIVLGWPIPGRADPAHAAHELLADLFGGAMSSPLFQAVRERRGLAYSVDAFAEVHDDAGTFQVSAGVAPRNLKTLFDVTCDELELLTRRIEPDDLQRARNQQKAHLLMTLERPMALAESIARDLMFRGRIVPPDEIVARSARIEAEELQALAQAMLSRVPTLAIAGPAGRGNHYANVLRRFGVRAPAAAAPAKPAARRNCGSRRRVA